MRIKGTILLYVWPGLSVSTCTSLLSLTNMIINGSNITYQTYDANLSQLVLTIVRLLMYNCIKIQRDKKHTLTIPQMDREVPFPIFGGFWKSML